MDETITIRDLLGCLERAAARVSGEKGGDYPDGESEPFTAADALRALRDEIEEGNWGEYPPIEVASSPIAPVAHDMRELVNGWIYRDKDDDLWYAGPEGVALLGGFEGRLLHAPCFDDVCCYFPLDGVREVGALAIKDPDAVAEACEGLL